MEVLQGMTALASAVSHNSQKVLAMLLRDNDDMELAMNVVQVKLQLYRRRQRECHYASVAFVEYSRST